MSLDSLLIAPGAPPQPTAEQQNALLSHLLRNRFLGVLDRHRAPKGAPHPWDVSISRLGDRAGMTLPADRTWRADIRPGTVNDTLPTILYRRADDPRGWSLPADYAAPAPGEPGFDALWIERDLLDDAEDPPFLAIRAPGAGGEPADMVRVPDDARPEAFMGEADWELELWQAHIIVSAAPIRATGFYSAAFPPPRLARYRIYVSARLPSPLFGARAGGWLELATLFLLRDPHAPELSEMFVRQREFWPLRAEIVQPGADIPGLITVQSLDVATGLPAADLAIAAQNETNQIFADLALAQVEDILAGTSTVEWWTA